MKISDAEARAVIEAGPAKPLAEWTMPEYSAALEAAGVRGRLTAEYEAHHRHAMAVVEKLQGAS